MVGLIRSVCFFVSAFLFCGTSTIPVSRVWQALISIIPSFVAVDESIRSLQLLCFSSLQSLVLRLHLLLPALAMTLIRGGFEQLFVFQLPTLVKVITTLRSTATHILALVSGGFLVSQVRSPACAMSFQIFENPSARCFSAPFRSEGPILCWIFFSNGQSSNNNKLL